MALQDELDPHTVRLNKDRPPGWPSWLTWYDGPLVSKTRHKRQEMRRKAAERAQAEQITRDATSSNSGAAHSNASASHSNASSGQSSAKAGD